MFNVVNKGERWPYSFSSFRGEGSCSSSSNPKSQMICYAKTMEIMMNNVVLMFSPTDERTPYEQGENRMVIRFSR